MYSKELKEICAKTTDKRFMISLSLDKTRKAPIEEATEWMNKHYRKISLKDRCFFVKNDITEDNVPKCPQCGNPVCIDKSYGLILNKFCSDKCSKAYGRLSEISKQRLLDYEWMYLHRIEKEMAYDSIGEILNCSSEPVRRACVNLGIPLVRMNESSVKVQVLIQNEEWMRDQYKTQGKTLQTIANEIGSSKATLSIAINKLGIDATPPNAYPRKNGKRSLEEIELYDYIRSILSDDVYMSHSDRSVLYDKEIDILIPSLGLGFEYNGLYSHYYRPEAETSARRKGHLYHLNKKQVAHKKGIDLIHIFSDDWKYRNDIVKSMISSKFKKNDRVFARKCEIIVPTNSEKINFLKANHLQGKDKSSIYYALKHEEEIVAIMTFCKSRYNKAYEWELSRYTVKKFVNVVGGFSKLLSYFRKNHIGSIISYADREHSTGEVFKNNGFCLLKVNPPSYTYVNFKINEERMHRANFMKKKIAPNDSRAEHEIMYERGYRQVFDCGTLTFVME